MLRRSPRARGPLVWLALAVLLLLAPSCGGGAMKAAEGSAPLAMPPSPPPVEEGESRAESAPAAERLAQIGGAPTKKAASSGPTDGVETGSAPPAVPPTASDAPRIATPLLIYTAELHISTFETGKAIDHVQKLALEAGGYLVSRSDLAITVRVPSERFDGTLESVTKVGDVLHRNVTARDVTDEFYDVQTRLRNAEAVLERLKELLRRAEKVGDALAVERELQRVAEEVERMKGRLKLLRELISFSTITVRFQPRATEAVGSKVNLPFPWLDSLGLGNLLSL